MADYRDIWSPAKVFSPSAAKHQTHLAKEWAYVDQWLAARYHPKPVPKFERNPDTLKALVALASANEAADEERALETKVKEKALAELKARDQAASENEESVLITLEENLTPEGTRALNSIALLSVALGSTSTDTQKLAKNLIDLTKEEFELKYQSLRIEALHKHLQKDLAHLCEKLNRMEHGEEFKVPPELAGQVVEWTRTSRHLRHKTEDYKERVEMLQFNSSRLATGLTVEAIAEQEKAVEALKEHVLNLESQAKGFQGLPPEKDLARLEVERVAKELEELEAKREKLYDTMVGI
ncbi:hypothetical protein L873DRAFT_1685755 [Choiromyces venosus 120613-1]|uniref:HAUS augmin-like complex subunit 1 n=1 Tax=Choiromyces venosus 120613-1 TaxID=1336337 RepID=A0A3N4JL43_9PEZI|nr:hypothetical protein L873DRAFT_1685755 [Choiromyces venosus 120613-1]